MRRLRYRLVFAAALWLSSFALWADSPGGEPTQERALGKQVFDRWCAACHSRGPNMPGTQALAAKYHGKVPAALEDREDLTPQLIAYYVRHGVSIMPFFRKTEIGDQDLQALGIYLSASGAPNHGPPQH